MKVIAVIPTKNEEDGIGSVLEEIPSIVNDVVVVDGSTDNTALVAAKHGARVIDERRKGYGRAYKTGFDSLSSDVDVIVTLDADGTYPASDIPKLVKMLDSEGLDFISCARRYNHVMSFKHKLGNGVLTFWSNVLFGTSLSDSQTGMWVFRRSVLDKINMESDGMPFSEEIKIRVLKAGLRFKEVSVEYRERIGEVVLNSFGDGIPNLLYLFMLRFGL